MNSPSMCDVPTRLWCCRIGLVLTISSVLLTMMFQIWSYYFYLIRDMDNLSSSVPKLHSILDVCNGSILTAWNVDCNKTIDNYVCSVSVQANSLQYVDSNCPLDSWLTVPVTMCCRTMLWILPW